MKRFGNLFNLSATLGLLLYCTLSSHAQNVKKEYEKSVKAEEIPDLVRYKAAPLLEDAEQVDYYEEYNGDELFYEIKMEWNEKQLSVEFYSDGRLMDIEHLITTDEIHEEAREQIVKYLEGYDRYKITRLQRQYSAEDQDEEDEEVIEEFIEYDTDDLTVRYEMVVYLKGKGKYGLFEFLFDDDGELIETQRVERRSPDNVLY